MNAQEQCFPSPLLDPSVAIEHRTGLGRPGSAGQRPADDGGGPARFGQRAARPGARAAARGSGTATSAARRVRRGGSDSQPRGGGDVLARRGGVARGRRLEGERQQLGDSDVPGLAHVAAGAR